MGVLGLLKTLLCKEAAKESPKSDGALSNRKKESTVRRVTSQDMIKFTKMPYHLDCTVKQSGVLGQDSFAYIDLSQENATVAMDELAQINSHLSAAHQVCRKVPKDISIPVKDIVFCPSQGSEYTRLICTPYTPSGKIAKYPLYLYFCTALVGNENTTHGKLYYGQNGCVQKALVCFWCYML